MSSLLLSLTFAYLVLIERLTTCHAQSHGDRIGECRLEHLSVMEPTKRVESEGGVAEFWDDKNQQLQCIGVTLIRYTIRPNGLLLPFYTNAPRIHYVLQDYGNWVQK
ncbi:legumin type B-like [Arachis ipaensis]|uniref:legumin type B-like n=1 Tax=Arachis ipaensis TaxID=130454 RepID=UPI0007AF93ED|nr:legumin type B-like [Arachis ipaensis]